MSNAEARPARRQMTYGKKRALALEMSYDADGSTKATLRQNMMRPSKLQSTSAQSRFNGRPTPPADDPSVFDVPLSDEENAQPKSTVGRLKKPQGTLKTATLEKRERLDNGKRVMHTEEEVLPAASATAHKRKREVQAEKFVPPRISPRAKAPVQLDTRHQSSVTPSKPPVKKPVGKVPPPASTAQSRINGYENKPRHLTRNRITHSPPKPVAPPPQELPSSPPPMLEELRQSDEESARKSTPSRQDSTVFNETRPAVTPTRSATPTQQSTPRVRPSLTPKQSQTWSKLLEDNIPPSPGQRSGLSPSGLPPLITTNKPQTTVRRKLIDTLLPSSENSRPIEDDEDSVPTSELANDEETPKGNSYSQSRSDLAAMSQQSLFVDPGPRKTYAIERSFLQEDATKLDDLLLVPFEPMTSPVVQSRGRRDFGRRADATIPARFDASDDDENEVTGGMKSIHELRAAGDSQRQDDEFNLILEDINNGPHATLSIRRSSSLELTRKLADAGFCDRFIQQGHVRQAFQSCHDVEDPILGTAMIAAMTMILSAPTSRHSSSYILEAGMLELITKMLNFERDLTVLAKDRKANMSKAAQENVRAFKAFVEATPWWKGTGLSIVSPQLMALHGFEVFVRKLRESGNMEQVLGVRLAGKILDVLQEFYRHVPSGSASTSTKAVPQLTLVLSILEYHTVSPACALDRAVWTSARLQQLVEHLQSILSIECDSSTNLQCLSLRICLNLANNSKRNSEAFAEPDLVSKMLSFINIGLASLSGGEGVDEEPRGFDILVLALGALINLAEWSETVRMIVLDSGAQELTKLLEFFVERRKVVSSVESLAESHANVAYGYLAVLLANLCSTSALKKYIRSRLPDHALSVLVEAVDEFVAHHKAVDGREQNTDTWAAFTDRLQSVSDGLKRIV